VNEEFLNNENNEFGPKQCIYLIEYLNLLDDYVHDFEWTEEMEIEAKMTLDENQDTIKDKKMIDFLDTQSKNWEKFYKLNKTNFFKDRHYILKEFPELKDDDRVN